jgi:hypothetical protein
LQKAIIYRTQFANFVKNLSGTKTFQSWRLVNCVVVFFPHSRAVHIGAINVLLPTDAQNNCFKRILKSTLKQLQHVSVLSPSSGSVQFELAEVMFVKTVH